jgi:uncharacterized protein DUF6690
LFRLLFLLLKHGFFVGAVALTPFLAFRAGDVWPDVKSRISTAISSIRSTDKSSSPAPSTVSSTVSSTGPKNYLAKKPIAGGQSGDHSAIYQMEQVFQFNINPSWIMNRWPRVSTGMAQLQLQGYRVSLVTGTLPSDLAGSLTYYYNPKQVLEKITFSGTTGDASRLIQILTKQYGFARRLTNDGGVYLYQTADDKGQVQSVLKVRSTGVIKREDRHSRYQVDLMLRRPAQLAMTNKPTRAQKR